MIKYKNDCVGPCPQGCIGSACRYRDVPYFYCDKCGEETDKLYSGSDGYDELCECCAKEEMKKSIEDFDFDELCEFFDYSEVAGYD